jgi:FtsZ-binding cell division protein ZapB
MVTLEQVRQLETKIAKAIDYVNRVNAEGDRLREENKLLQGKLDDSGKRVGELEESVRRFKEDQSRIEEGIVAALDRLNEFEDAIGKSLSSVQAVVSSSQGASPEPSGSPEPDDAPEPSETADSPDAGETGASELDIF